MSERVEFANLLRGIAASSVVVSHYLGSFWYYRRDVSDLTGLPALQEQLNPTPSYVEWLYQIPGLYKGGFGVGLFFLISGFVIPFSFSYYTRCGFIVARVFRLWPAYAVGFGVTASAIAIGTWYWKLPLPYSLDAAFVHAILGIRDYLGVKSLDGIIWTLEVEIKFYVVAVIISPWLRRGSLWAFVGAALAWLMTIGCVAILAGYLGDFPYGILLAAYATGFGAQFIVFMFIGVALNFAYRGLQPTILMLFVCLILLLAFLALCEFGIFRDFRYGLTYPVALAIFLLIYFFPQLLPNVGLLRWLADISYSFYICHGVAGYVLMIILLNSGLSPAASVIITTCAALSVSFLLYRFVERPTRRAGQRLAARLSGPTSSR